MPRPLRATVVERRWRAPRVGRFGLGLALALVFCAPVAANPDLARAHNCLNCHQIDRKVVGPAFRDVARRYGGDAHAEERLAEKIRLGGAGAWGAVPMPANAVSADEARQLAHWILSLQ